MKRLLPHLLLCPFAFGLLTTAHAQLVYIDDVFNYADGALGSPWSVSASGNSAATVGAAQTFNDYTPAGKEVTLVRPTTGDGLVSATLATGANAGSSAWTITTGDQVQLTVDFSLDSLDSGNAISYFLRGGSTTIFGFRVKANGSDPQIQLMTTSSTSSFDYAAGTPTLAMDTWYRLVVDLEVTSSTTTTSSITLEQLGTGGGVVYELSGLVLTAPSIGSSSSFMMGTSSGTPSFTTANVQLSSIPEPASTVLLVGSSLLIGLVLRRYRRRVSAD
ncbi:MAG: PEP-CTERM sorting domain-containing protein [Verrucomicrobiota bacterium JB024]|nr:PEP-CTERM sorting domain-containing protein [Verrucomicrobiota bacterium JB024]